MSPGGIHVTSTVLADNVLKITAACTVNLHYMNSVSTRPDRVSVDLTECWISPFSAFRLFLQRLLNGSQALATTGMYNVGCHYFHSMNTCLVVHKCSGNLLNNAMPATPRN